MIAGIRLITSRATGTGTEKHMLSGWYEAHNKLYCVLVIKWADIELKSRAGNIQQLAYDIFRVKKQISVEFGEYRNDADTVNKFVYILEYLVVVDRKRQGTDHAPRNAERKTRYLRIVEAAGIHHDFGSESRRYAARHRWLHRTENTVAHAHKIPDRIEARFKPRAVPRRKYHTPYLSRSKTAEQSCRFIGIRWSLGRHRQWLVKKISINAVRHKRSFPCRLRVTAIIFA